MHQSATGQSTLQLPKERRVMKHKTGPRASRQIVFPRSIAGHRHNRRRGYPATPPRHSTLRPAFRAGIEVLAADSLLFCLALARHLVSRRGRTKRRTVPSTAPNVLTTLLATIISGTFTRRLHCCHRVITLVTQGLTAAPARSFSQGCRIPQPRL